MVIICPWCGTNYLVFQSNCKNCGGPLPAVAARRAPAFPAENSAPAQSAPFPAPPPPPRPIAGKYVWRILSTDAWAVAAFVFCLLGGVFAPLGAILTIALVTALVGLPFLLIGMAFLAAGAGILLWRYQRAQKILAVLREGSAAGGQIVEVSQDYTVRINHRHPWVVRYQFQVNGQSQEGQVATLNQLGPQLQAGKPTWVLYLPSEPQWNSIYPHP